MAMRKTRHVLLDRCRGPGAVSIGLLIKRAEVAVESVVRDFGKYVTGRLSVLAALAEVFLADRHDAEKRLAFQMTLRDLQTSGATASSPWIAKYAGMLQVQIGMREALDENLPTIVHHHLDAIKVAASSGVLEEELVRLENMLDQLSQALKR